MITAGVVHTGSRGLGSSILPSQTRTRTSFLGVQSFEHTSTNMIMRSNGRRQIPTSLPIVSSIVSSTRVQIRFEAVEGEDTDMPTIVEVDEPKVGEVEPGVDSREALVKLLDVMHNTLVRQGWIVIGQTQEVWIHRKGAAPSYQAFIPCPGSRGDLSWILQTSGDGQINGVYSPLKYLST
jgi:release factor H-coupled RctB family protein